MIRNEEARKPLSFTDRRSHAPFDDPLGQPEARTIVIRQGGGWQSLALLFLCLLLGAAVLMGHWVVRDLDRKNQQTAAVLAQTERKMQQLESGLAFEARRRHLLLGMRNHILKANPRVSLAEVYHYAELAVREREVPRGGPALPARGRRIAALRAAQRIPITTLVCGHCINERQSVR